MRIRIQPDFLRYPAAILEPGKAGKLPIAIQARLDIVERGPYVAIPAMTVRRVERPTFTDVGPRAQLPPLQMSICGGGVVETNHFAHCLAQSPDEFSHARLRPFGQ